MYSDVYPTYIFLQQALNHRLIYQTTAQATFSRILFKIFRIEKLAQIISTLQRKICTADFRKLRPVHASHSCRVEFNSIQLSAAEMCLSIHTSQFCPIVCLQFMLSAMSVSGKCFRRRVFNMADCDTEGTKDLNFAKNYPPMELGDEMVKAGQCSSLFCSMLRLRWDENGQISSFFLAGPNLCMLMTLK